MRKMKMEFANKSLFAYLFTSSSSQGFVTKVHILRYNFSKNSILLNRQTILHRILYKGGYESLNRRYL